MQSIKDWGSYMTSSVGYAASEVWQLGVDAKNEAYNVYSEFYNDTADILGSLTTDSYTQTTPGMKREKSEVDTNDVDINVEGGKSPSGIFSVEKYTEQAAPALLMPSAAEIKLKDKHRLSANNSAEPTDNTQLIELEKTEDNQEEDGMVKVSLSEAKKISTTTAI